MKALFLFTLVTIITSPILAQTMTKDQALDLAQQLHDIELLSEKGKQLLITYIQKDKLLEEHFNPHHSKEGIAKYALLTFLEDAFCEDYCYRTGAFERNKVVSESSATTFFEQLHKELEEVEEKELSPEEEQAELLATQKKMETIFLQMQQEKIEKMKTYKGFQIEEKIPDEEEQQYNNIAVFKNRSSTRQTYLATLSTEKTKILPELELIHERRSVLGKTRTRTLHDLLQLGLIDNSIHQKALNALQDGSVFSEYDLLEFCTKEIDARFRYPQEKQQQLEQLDQLYQAQLLSKNNLNTIKNSYQAWELQDKFDWLFYCKNAKFFSSENYPADPIKALIPNFNYKQLNVQFVEKEHPYGNDLIEKQLSVSFELDGTTYAYTSYYDYVSINKKETHPTLLKMPHGIQTIVNKVLNDRNAKERLYFANKSVFPTSHEKEGFGLILMTKDQCNAWGGTTTYFLSQESHDNSLTSRKISNIVTDLENLGLFVHLTPTELLIAKEELNSRLITQYQDILLAFPKTIVFFDWETGNLENPYEELTQAFGEITRGLFTPTNIVDEFAKSWEKPTTLFSFDFKGKTYSTSLKMERDWLDPTFMSLISTALKEQGIEGDFYPCLNNGQAGGYMYLSKEQHQQLEKMYPQFLEEGNGF